MTSHPFTSIYDYSSLILDKRYSSYQAGVYLDTESIRRTSPLSVQVPRKLIGTDAFQETPIVEVTRQITKHNYLVMDLADLPRIVKEVMFPAPASPETPECELHCKQ